MLKTSATEVCQTKTLQRNTNYSASKTFTRVINVANEIYLMFLKLLIKLQCELSCILRVGVA